MNAEKRKRLALIAAGVVLGVLLTLLIQWGISARPAPGGNDGSGSVSSSQVSDHSESGSALSADGSDGSSQPDQSAAPDGSDPAGSSEVPDQSANPDSSATPDSSGQSQTPDGSEEPDSSAEPEQPIDPDAPSPSSSQDTWSAEAVYNGGDQVIYGGGVFRARWWTQNETPDKNAQWGVWEFIGMHDPAPEEPDPDTEDNDTDMPIEIEHPKVDVEDFKVVGYYPSWKTGSMDHINFDVITNIMYAFAIPTADGELRPLENADFAKKLINEAHKHGVKVSIAIGGWSYNDTPLEPTFVSATNTDEKVKKLGNCILDLVDEMGFDGVDMDWEHPRKDDNSKKQYEALMLYLSKELKKEGKLLTSAVLSGATADGNIYYDAAAHSDKVLEAVDWVNVMAYDGGDGERHSSYQFAVDSANYWHKTRKMPAHKVVLGVPFYGRPSWQSYENILQANPDAWKTDISDIYGMEAHYNGVATIQKKTKFAMENVGGVMIWELTQDSTDPKTSLQSAIGKMLD